MFKSSMKSAMGFVIGLAIADLVIHGIKEINKNGVTATVENAKANIKRMFK
jgi:hypothetical protein